jgi:hypothetical protein
MGTPALQVRSNIVYNKMPISKTAIIFIVFVLTLSAFVANISNLISVVEKTPVTYSSRRMEDNEINADQREATKVTLGKSSEHLMWFIQVCIVK